MEAELVNSAFFLHSYEIVLQIKNLRFSFAVSKTIPIFATLNILTRRRRSPAFSVGIFYAQWYHISSDPRVECLMASRPCQGVQQRESGTFFFFYSVYALGY